MVSNLVTKIIIAFIILASIAVFIYFIYRHNLNNKIIVLCHNEDIKSNDVKFQVRNIFSK